jgi:hypothetical protein
MPATTRSRHFRVSDAEISARVLKAIGEMGSPARADDLRRMTRGQARRIDLAVRHLVEAGLLVKTDAGYEPAHKPGGNK